jgi:excinuclease ABC subunit B
MVLLLRVGDKMGQRDLIAAAGAHAVRAQRVRLFKRGKFRVRGDTIDIFPAEHSEMAMRVELFDDEVETLRCSTRSPARCSQKIPRFTVYPSQPLRDAARAPRSRRSTDQDRAAERMGQLQACGKLVEAQRSSSARASTSRC